MPDTTTVLVTIGRNVGTQPLSNVDWGQFQTALQAEGHPSPIVGLSSGWGEWDGVQEENYSVTFAVPSVAVPSLRKGIARLARRWQQDGIGFVILNDETYIPAARPAPRVLVDGEWVYPSV